MSVEDEIHAEAEEAAAAATTELKADLALIADVGHDVKLEALDSRVAALEGKKSDIDKMLEWFAEDEEEGDDAKIVDFETRLAALETWKAVTDDKGRGPGGQFRSDKPDIDKAPPAAPLTDQTPGVKGGGTGLFRRIGGR